MRKVASFFMLISMVFSESHWLDFQYPFMNDVYELLLELLPLSQAQNIVYELPPV